LGTDDLFICGLGTADGGRRTAGSWPDGRRDGGCCPNRRPQPAVRLSVGPEGAFLRPLETNGSAGWPGTAAG